MSYSLRIVCLANSRKHSGRCIAGKATEGSNKGAWIRPIGPYATHEITERDREYADGSTAQKLDVIKIVFANAAPISFQEENHVIDNCYYWEKLDKWTVADLATLEDHPLQLWENGNHSYSGVNDRVSVAILTEPRQSIFLIQPESVRFKVSAEGANFGDNKKIVRAKFIYNGQNYALRVTDPDIEQQYKAMPSGEYSANVNYFTISLGEPYKDEAYKLVAAVF